MSDRFCDVDARFMVRILDGYTYSIGCEHKDLAVVTQYENGDCYLTLFLDKHVTVAFRFSEGIAMRLRESDGHHE